MEYLTVYSLTSYFGHSSTAWYMSTDNFQDDSNSDISSTQEFAPFGERLIIDIIMYSYKCAFVYKKV